MHAGDHEQEAGVLKAVAIGFVFSALVPILMPTGLSGCSFGGTEIPNDKSRRLAVSTSKRTTGSKNRLAGETSPYLLQHADNPVDWYPWGAEALEKARSENKPILLSIGYSSCHWCHVMEHESFESKEIARLMNENFVNIKVDREERPDLDEIYMKAVQLMTGHGGWPMTVFLTPDLEPFFAGTYFPPEDRHGMPGFTRVLTSVAAAWRNNRDQIDTSSGEIAAFLRQFDKVTPAGAQLERQPVEMAVDYMLHTFDHQWGGFGSAPKFPFPCNLYLAMRCLAKESPLPASKREQCLQMVTTTLDRMAYGGMHDQIGGGFARYSVDRKWLIPHFEKMLYDNATLSKAYFQGYTLTGRRYWRQVGTDCLDFVLSELTTPEGAFYSSLDADSEGVEGKFYVWRPEEVTSVLGADDGRWVNEVYGVSIDGNFEHGTSVLHLPESLEALARRYGISEKDFWDRLDPLRARLVEARSKRVRPGRDEKVLTSWNGLMISGFVEGYKATREQRYLDAARKAAEFIMTKLQVKGRLLRTYGQGRAKLNGYLDDYSFFIQALLDLAEVDFDPRWYDNAVSLTGTMLKHFWDEEQAGFFYTSDDHETLLTRPKNYYDGSTPSGTSVAVMSLMRLASLTGKAEYRDRAEQAIKLFMPHFHKAPEQFANMICALDFDLSSPLEIALVADSSKSDWQKLRDKLYDAFLPNSVMLLKDTAGDGGAGSPLLEARGLVDGKPAVYICRNFTCDKPITDITALKTKLDELTARP
jgi:hypothetical protein